MDGINAHLKAGESEEALLVFLREIAEIPTNEIDLLRSLPSWPARVLAAHTMPRELTSEENYSFDPDRFRNLKTPTLLLLGGESPSFMKVATETLHAALPNSRIAVLPGQQHIAMSTASELFLREVISFLFEKN